MPLIWVSGLTHRRSNARIMSALPRGVNHSGGSIWRYRARHPDRRKLLLKNEFYADLNTCRHAPWGLVLRDWSFRVSAEQSAKGDLAVKILLVDDHVLLREALRGALNELEAEAAIFEASDSRETMQFVQQNPDVDLILLDLNLPDRDGFGVLAEIRQRYPSISVVIMSALQDRENVVRALDLGAVGFIPKSAGRKIILGALQLVFSGGIYIPPQALSGPGATPPPTTLPSPSRSGGPDETAAVRPAASPTDLGVTERQLDVLALMMQGKSNKAICRVLNLAEPTVKNHVRAILKALKATNRTEAVIAVGELKWKLPPVANS